MSGILVDYTTIYDFMYYSVLEENDMLTEKNKGIPLKTSNIMEFLYALMLWDNIYYLEKTLSPSMGRSDFWLYRGEDIGVDLSDYKLESMTELFYFGSYDQNQVDFANKELYDYYEQLSNGVDRSDSFYLKSAISYLIWGSYYGVNVLISPEKSNVLKKYHVE